MQLAVINKKGGVGKTPFAFSLAKDLDMFLQSNDNSTIESIYPNKAKIQKTVKAIDNCVYDFGGFVETGILNIIDNCDYIIIPCQADINSIARTIETITEVQKYNKNIIVLATNLRDKSDADEIKNEINSRIENIVYFEFKYSRIVYNAIAYGNTFTELYKENALSKNSYKKFYKEYSKLLKYIKKNR